MRNFQHTCMVMFVSALVLSACGGSDGSTPASTSTPAPTVTVTSSSVIEGNAGATSLVFTVASNITSSQAITINFSTQDGTALAGSDYVATSGVLTFPAGATGGSISVPVLGDTAIESDETFTLLLSSPNNASFAGASIIGTIINDDFPATPPSDTSPPVIVLSGANPLTIMQGTTFTDPGSTVIDNVDTGLIAVVTGTVNTSVAGTYTLSYDVSDAAGNAATTVTRTVKVLPATGADQTAPTIFLIGANPVTVAQGSSFVDSGSMVMDNVNTGLISIVTGTVNTSVVGAYTLTYNVSDAAGNAAAAVTRTVNVTDQTAPVITLTGLDPYTVAQGSVFTDPGATVTDNVDANSTITGAGTVNTAIVGTYTLTYNVSDAAGNAAVAVTRTVNVTDQTAPVIALTGANPVTVAQGSTYLDAGSSVTDNVDAGLTATVTGTVNTAVVGTYTLTYNVSDTVGNAATPVTRTVNVSDQTAPVIALTGANPVTIAQGSTYVDAGSGVTDNVDTGLAATVTGTVNTTLLGTYTLTYNVSDIAGNAAVAVTRTVNVTDQTVPVIALTGANPMTVAQGSVFTDPGSSVTDNVDAGLTATVTGTVNTAVVGPYTLTYNVSDAAGNPATTVTRTVNVIVPPSLSIANASAAEGSSLGTSNLPFTVTLSAASAVDTIVTYATSDGTALSASDYTAANVTLTIPAGNTSGTITILVNADANFEANETLTLTLTNPVNATLGTSTATGTILNDDVGGINDTGITKWGDASVNNLMVTQALFPNQDADRGRDSVVGIVKTGGGKAGFDFTKLDAAGLPLANQAATYAVTPWDCVKDNVTGLMWEVKTTTPTSLRNKNNIYTWYNSTGVNDGGNLGAPAATPACATGGLCDTEKYVAAVNAVGVCGFNDWRLPNNEALRSIVDYSIAFPGPTIDTTYFPNTVNSWYWSSSPYAALATIAWTVNFDSGNDSVLTKSGNFYVRLVRGGQ